jgi:hypothetical protein
MLYLFFFKKNHTEYVKKLEEVESLKKSYSVQFEKYKKKLKQLETSIAQYEESNIKNREESEENGKLAVIKTKVITNLDYMKHISDTFPKSNG